MPHHPDVWSPSPTLLCFSPCFGQMSSAQPTVWVMSIMRLEVNGKGKAKQKFAAEPLLLTLHFSASGRASWLRHKAEITVVTKDSEIFPRSQLPDWEYWWNTQMNNTLFSSPRKEQKVMKINKRKSKHEIWIKEDIFSLSTVYRQFWSSLNLANP